MQHPDLLFELQKSMRIDHNPHRIPFDQRPATSLFKDVRTAIGRSLIATGNRLAPAPCPDLRSTSVAGTLDLQPCA